jgi:hypothetical protein
MYRWQFIRFYLKYMFMPTRPQLERSLVRMRQKLPITITIMPTWHLLFLELGLFKKMSLKKCYLHKSRMLLH